MLIENAEMRKGAQDDFARMAERGTPAMQGTASTATGIAAEEVSSGDVLFTTGDGGGVLAAANNMPENGRFVFAGIAVTSANGKSTSTQLGGSAMVAAHRLGLFSLINNGNGHMETGDQVFLGPPNTVPLPGNTHADKHRVGRDVRLKPSLQASGPDTSLTLAREAYTNGKPVAAWQRRYFALVDSLYVTVQSAVDADGVDDAKRPLVAVAAVSEAARANGITVNPVALDTFRALYTKGVEADKAKAEAPGGGDEGDLGGLPYFMQAFAALVESLTETVIKNRRASFVGTVVRGGHPGQPVRLLVK